MKARGVSVVTESDYGVGVVYPGLKSGILASDWLEWLSFGLLALGLGLGFGLTLTLNLTLTPANS